MKIKLLKVSGLLLMLSPAYGLQPAKQPSQQKQNRVEASTKSEEFQSPHSLAIDSTAIGILDGKIIPFNTVKELSLKNQIQIVHPYSPKEAIQEFGEIARGGVFICITIRN